MHGEDVDTGDVSTERGEVSDGSCSPSTGDEAIAVDCQSQPVEVIVKGKNVQQVRVKFPPRTPQPPGGRPPSTHSRAGRRASGAGQGPRGAAAHPEEDLPLPKEDTQLPAHHSSASLSLSSLSQDNSAMDEGARARSFFNRQQSATWAVDLDSKHRLDVLAGLEYFERKSCGLRDEANQMMQQLDAVKRANQEHEQHVLTLTKDYSRAMAENDELKIKVDSLEKENMLLQDQALNEWRSRVKAEEMYVEKRRDFEAELKRTKERHSALDKQEKVSKDSLKLKLERIQEELSQVTKDKEMAEKTNQLLKSEMLRLKESLCTKEEELGKLSARVMSLKKTLAERQKESDVEAKLSRPTVHQQTVASPRGDENDQLCNATWPAAANSNITLLPNFPPDFTKHKDFLNNGGSQELTTGRGAPNTCRRYLGTTAPAQPPRQHNDPSPPLLSVQTLQAPKGTTAHRRNKSDHGGLPAHLPPVHNLPR